MYNFFHRYTKMYSMYKECRHHNTYLQKILIMYMQNVKRVKEKCFYVYKNIKFVRKKQTSKYISKKMLNMDLKNV